MARVRFSPIPPTKSFCRRRLVARIVDLQSADGSSILLAGTKCPVRPMDQDRTLRTFRFGFESRAGYQALKWWPSGTGPSLSMRIRWVRLPSTSPESSSRPIADKRPKNACLLARLRLLSACCCNLQSHDREGVVFQHPARLESPARDCLSHRSVESDGPGTCT